MRKNTFAKEIKILDGISLEGFCDPQFYASFFDRLIATYHDAMRFYGKRDIHFEFRSVQSSLNQMVARSGLYIFPEVGTDYRYEDWRFQFLSSTRWKIQVPYDNQLDPEITRRTSIVLKSLYEIGESVDSNFAVFEVEFPNERWSEGGLFVHRNVDGKWEVCRPVYLVPEVQFASESLQEILVWIASHLHQKSWLWSKSF